MAVCIVSTWLTGAALTGSLSNMVRLDLQEEDRSEAAAISLWRSLGPDMVKDTQKRKNLVGSSSFSLFSSPCPGLLDQQWPQAGKCGCKLTGVALWKQQFSIDFFNSFLLRLTSALEYPGLLQLVHVWRSFRRAEGCLFSDPPSLPSSHHFPVPPTISKDLFHITNSLFYNFHSSFAVLIKFWLGIYLFFQILRMWCIHLNFWLVFTFSFLEYINESKYILSYFPSFFFKY